MTLKQRAIIQTAAIIAVIVTTSVGMTLILEQLTREQILFALSAGSIALLIYSMYGVVLSRLEYNETVNKLVDKSAK
jgi:Na+-transporting methylmalonyl-CoA/oxaloacetate decarboxylase beta subunit